MYNRYTAKWRGMSAAAFRPGRKVEASMKHRSKMKWLALCGVVALGLTLTSCYIPPDEISDDDKIGVGNQNLPFSTIAPQQQATATPTVKPQQSTAPSQPTVNWDAWGGTTATTAPGTGSPSVTSPVATLPSNTIAVVTSKPTNTPGPATPTPTPSSLQKGMEGAEVRKMQQRLKDLGYLNGSADGDFGDATLEAVKTFQRANGLSVDGKAGKNTLNKLYSDSAISKRSYDASRATATPKPTKKPTQRPTATATPNLSKDIYLRLGNSGKNVRTLQNRLIELGWLAGSADGEFGGATEAAVIAFQAREGLWDDGVAGPSTLEELYSNKAAKTSTVVASVGVTLKEGMNGASVRALQKRLKNLGYYDGSLDGDYGAETIAAVKNFQKQNGLSADGKAGTDTLNKIYLSTTDKATSTGNAASSGTVASTGYVTLREGDDSDAVRKLQRKLKDLGYYSGSVDGDYGSGTTTAVKLFQDRNDLTVDGIAGPQTQRVLYGTNATSIKYSSLKEGDRGTAVTNLQYTLYELGYYDGDIDGVFGTTTKDAVRAFQIRNKLSVDGKAGSATMKKLYSSSAVPAQAVDNDFDTLEKGDKGEIVISLQDTLVQLGYMSDVTGLYDTATVEAVKLFQKYNGLSVDGKAGASTQKKLFGDSAKPYPGN